jgi:hypothetical protein
MEKQACRAVRRPPRPQPPAPTARSQPRLQLADRHIDIDLLLFEGDDAVFELLAGVRELAPVVGRIVHLEKFPDLGQRKAQSPPAQNENNSRPILHRVDARLSAPLGPDQTFVLVEAQRPCGDGKFLGQLSYRESSVHCGSHRSTFAGPAAYWPTRLTGSDALTSPDREFYVCRFGCVKMIPYADSVFFFEEK